MKTRAPKKLNALLNNITQVLLKKMITRTPEYKIMLLNIKRRVLL